uniref:inactive tyrosine-protein kinase 7a n=1 Tax=Centroberyx gerrardi TaxID=166262 RepID=UPI003AB09DAD
MATQKDGSYWSWFLASVHSSASFHFTKEPKSQDALHGRSAMLRCEVSQSEGVSLRWLQDGRPLGESERRFQEAGSLKFLAVDRRLDAGSFQCVASLGGAGEELRSNNASFNIKWLESGGVSLQEPQSEQQINTSSSVTLRCHIDGHPRPVCVWFRDGVPLQEEAHQMNSRDRTLTLRSVAPGDSGLYSCCGSNAAGQTCSNRNFSLNVIDDSWPRPLLVPDSVVVLRNQPALLHCSFTASPPCLRWYHEQESVSNKSRVLLLSNGSLLITQVKPRNTGRYRCEATGVRGPPAAVEATVSLAELEDFGPGFPRVFEDGTPQRIDCSPPRAFPAPQVWWESGGRRLGAEPGRVFQDGLSLVFAPVLRQDAGSYSCVVQNQAGTRRQEVAVSVATSLSLKLVDKQSDVNGAKAKWLTLTPPASSSQWLTPPEDSERDGPAPASCTALAEPRPRRGHMYRNFLPITNEDARFRLFPNGTLRINSVEVYDSIVYICQTQNPGGRLEGRARVQVL